MGFLCEREGGRGGGEGASSEGGGGVGSRANGYPRPRGDSWMGGSSRRGVARGKGGGRTCETTCSADSLILLNAPMRGDALADTSVMA